MAPIFIRLTQYYSAFVCHQTETEKFNGLVSVRQACWENKPNKGLVTLNKQRNYISSLDVVTIIQTIHRTK